MYRNANDNGCVLGIDFGTTYTYIVKYDGHSFERHMDETSKRGNVNDLKGVPTRIGFTIDSEKKFNYFVGEEVTKKLAEEGVKIENGKKATLADGTVMYYDDALKSDLRSGKEKTTFECDDIIVARQDLAIAFFKKVLSKYIVDKSIKCICVGKTAKNIGSDTDVYTGILLEIFSKVFGIRSDINIVIREEPTLAAISYTTIKGLDKDCKMLVVDIGGGTSDFSIIEVKSNKLRVLGSSGNIHPGGRVIDNYILDKLGVNIDINKIMDAKEELFPSIFSDTFKDETRTKDYFDYISKDRDALISIGEKKYIIKIRENENNCDSRRNLVDITDVVNGEVVDTLTNGLTSFIHKNNDAYGDVDSILFLGGTSHIKQLRNGILNSLLIGINCETNKSVYCLCEEDLKIKDDITKGNQLTYTNAVAVGAALYAWDRLSNGHRYEIKTVPKLELGVWESFCKEEESVVILDQGMITNHEFSNKGPCILSGNNYGIRIIKDGESYPDPNVYDQYKMLNNMFNDSEIIILADNFEEDNDNITSIVACDLYLMAKKQYEYVYKLNDGKKAILNFQENNASSNLSNASDDSNKALGRIYKLSNKNNTWEELDEKELEKLGFKKATTNN